MDINTLLAQQGDLAVIYRRQQYLRKQLKARAEKQRAKEKRIFLCGSEINMLQKKIEILLPLTEKDINIKELTLES